MRDPLFLILDSLLSELKRIMASTNDDKKQVFQLSQFLILDKSNVFVCRKCVKTEVT